MFPSGGLLNFMPNACMATMVPSVRGASNRRVCSEPSWAWTRSRVKLRSRSGVGFFVEAMARPYPPFHNLHSGGLPYLVGDARWRGYDGGPGRSAAGPHSLATGADDACTGGYTRVTAFIRVTPPCARPITALLRALPEADGIGGRPGKQNGVLGSVDAVGQGKRIEIEQILLRADLVRNHCGEAQRSEFDALARRRPGDSRIIDGVAHVR